jgi:nitroreductase
MRKAQYPILDLILNRWSPRAMTGEEISNEQLMTLFEAARWAPSSYNGQPWRFVYAMRNSPDWQNFFDLLVPFNQSWTKNAAVLVITASRNDFSSNGKFARTHSFDTGAAWENIALQGFHDGLVVHGMEGFDYTKAKKVINLPDNYSVEMMFAVGKLAPIETLPEDLKKREVPSDRLPLSELVFEGIFKNNTK